MTITPQKAASNTPSDARSGTASRDAAPVAIERTSYDLGDVTLTCLEARPRQGAGPHPVVLLAHGFPDEPYTFEAQLGALARAGYHAVAPYMRGYAPSSRSLRGGYGANDTGADLLALADRLSPDFPVRLVGHDWGSLAVLCATAMAPGRVEKLVTMAVPHPGALVASAASLRQLRRSWYIAFFQLPGLPERRLRKDGYAFIDELWRAWSPGYTPSHAELAAVKAAIAPRVPEVLAYYRTMRRPSSFRPEIRRLYFARVPVPALHLHGRDDGCIGPECSDGAEGFYDGGYRRILVDAAGHFLTREQPEVVNAALLDFFGPAR